MKPSDPIRQRQAMNRRVERRMTCEGKITLPAVPGMVDDYTTRCEQAFAAFGRKLSETERLHLKKIIESQLNAAFKQSQRSSIIVSYQSGVGEPLNYFVSSQFATVEQAYAEWVGARNPPYFGTEPDAKVLALAGKAEDRKSFRVLDIGAGTGRNALALARLGHPVDAVELTPNFAEILSETACQESLSVRVICKDIFSAKQELVAGYHLIVLSEVVSDFRSVEQLRLMFELASQSLAPGGLLVINAFITKSHYSADDAAREFSQLVYTGFFTRGELASAIDGLPLEQVSDECVYDYEKSHLPDGGWPPTPWYPEWVSGLDVFDMQRDDSPISLRWIVYRKIQ